MPAATRNDARLDFRLTRKSKHLIDRAVGLTGQTITEFAISALVDKARQVLEQEHLRVLSDRDRDVFLAMLDADIRPNAALRRAAQRYKANHGRES